MWNVRPCRGCWRCPAHVACAAGSVPSPPSRRRGACLRTEEERRGVRRTDEEALRLPKAQQSIGRGEPLGGYRRHGRPEARRPQRGEPPARGQAGRHRWWAASGRGRGTGRGPAGRRGHGRGRRGPPHGPHGGRGVGGRLRPRQRAGLLPGQDQRLRHAGRRWPEQGGGRRRKARPGRTRCLPGRSRVAGVGQRDGGRQEERRPLPRPAGDFRSASALGGPGRRHDRRAHPCRDRGPQGHGEDSPAAEEQEATPEHAEADAPEPPDTVIPAAPVVQAGNQIVEGAGRAHVSGSSPSGAHRQAPRRCTVSPVCNAPLRGWCAADTGGSSSLAPSVATCWIVVKYFSHFPPLSAPTDGHATIAPSASGP